MSHIALVSVTTDANVPIKTAAEAGSGDVLAVETAKIWPLLPDDRRTATTFMRNAHPRIARKSIGNAMTVEIDAPPNTFTCSECNRSGFRRWQLSLFGTPQVCCHACHERARRKQHRHRQSFCAVCSTSFITTRTDALYCSASCKQKAYVERVGGGKAGQRRFAE